ncbi:hypothetical protein F5Y07DRAFT_103790 [Xylaria sp. FL0933]|nr:hypothetical protein F5Y07DRAFT_103790 [Xylaria sp. FL0933]
MVACTQPRVLPAIGASQHVARQQDVKIGQEIGFSVRFNNNRNSNTRLAFMTDGILVRESDKDSDFSKYAAVILDEALTEEALNVKFFDFSHGPTMTSRQVDIELDENDQRLLDHFIQFVLPTIFPILETNQHGSVSSDPILPTLQNKGYLHCCLMIAAQHFKATINI